MKTFTSIDHDGHWPVPVASVVIAEDERQARLLLNKALKKSGLNLKDRHSNKKYTLQEVKLNTAVVLSDGEY